MPDPIEELSNFDPGVPVSPLPAAEVRARGERLRRRNTALVVAGAVAAVLLVAVPVAVFAGDDDGSKPQPATGLTDAVLLTADEVPARERLTEWRQADQDGEVLACAPEPVSSLDPQSSVRRDFAADIAGGPAEGPPVSAVRTAVLEFADPAAAGTAYEATLGWVTECPAVDNVNRDSAASEVVIDGGGQGEWRMRSYLYPEACDGDCDAVMFDRMGVAQFGDRLVLVSLAEVGGPLEPEGLDGTMEELFFAAVTKAGGEITEGTAIDGGTGDPEPAQGALDVPLDWDLVDLTGDGGEILGPGPKAQGADEVSPCDRVVWPETGVDRLALTTTGPEFIESRELVVFDSADQAVAIMEGVRSAIAACPTEINEQDPTTSPEQAWDVLQADIGYDSVTFSLTYTDGLPGGQIWQLTRVGKAIIAVSTGGEYSRQSVSAAAARLTEITGHMTPEMCEYSEAGC